MPLDFNEPCLMLLKRIAKNVKGESNSHAMLIIVLSMADLLNRISDSVSEMW